MGWIVEETQLNEGHGHENHEESEETQSLEWTERKLKKQQMGEFNVVACKCIRKQSEKGIDRVETLEQF